MKTQISRNSFKAKKRYSGVYQQQGRMLTDADWNNLVDVLKGHLAEALKDVVGTGSPREGELAIDADDLTIIPGDLYVDGLRSSLPDPGAGRIPVTDQPDFPEAPALPDPAVDPYVVYADVWERSLTALEDPDLRDAGLNGADTGTRTQSMLQVKICPENVDPEKEIPQHGDASLSLTLHGSQTSGDPCDPCAGQVDAGEGRIGNYLFRVEVHRFEGTAADPTRLTLKWSSENGAEQYEALSETLMPPGFVDSRYMYEFFNLISEKHLGVHMVPGFSPTSGILTPDYEIPDGTLAPKVFVRRWDGYCELVANGSAWSLADGWDKGVDLSTTVTDTAPGHVSLDSDSTLSVNLEALKLELTLKDKIFIAGDYWLAPVREAEHITVPEVLADAPPEGIFHHYLRLAQVAADGSVQLYDNDADERRHKFPPLTDLLAGDVGYLRDPTDDCANGLFDDTHDNVDKALDRLCELAAEHIHYQADCSQGLFQGFKGTVKGALDQVCDIQAADVGFSKPCDTGFYQGQTVTTVADALGLLCDAQTGGCKVTVGEGGVFNTLEEALNELLNRGQSHICLCLLPGKHMLPGQVIKAPLAGVHLCLSGCGSCTRLYVEQAPAHFSGFDVLCLSAMEIITRNVAAGALIFENCRDVSLRDASVFGFTADGSLIEVREARAVTLHDLLLEASGPESLEKPGKFLDLHPALTDLYKLADRTVFDNKATEAAKELAALGVQDRQTLGKTIDDRAIDPAAELAPRERKSYRELAEQLGLPSPDPAQIDAALRSIRLEAVRMRPTVALAIMDAGADWSLRDCDILGIIMFHGSKPSGPLPVDLTKPLDTLVSQGSVTFVGTTAAFKASGCRATRIDISAGLGDRLENIVLQKGGVIDGLFTTGMLSDCTLVTGESQLAVLNTNISSTVFEVANTRAALVIGESSIYVGNRGGGETVIVNITSPNRTERAANLQLDISA